MPVGVRSDSKIILILLSIEFGATGPRPKGGPLGPSACNVVGIHARSGRAKIESTNVAHVMNSELLTEAELRS